MKSQNISISGEDMEQLMSSDPLVAAKVLNVTLQRYLTESHTVIANLEATIAELRLQLASDNGAEGDLGATAEVANAKREGS